MSASIFLNRSLAFSVGLIFWALRLLAELPGDVGSDFGRMGALFLALGICLPVATVLVFYFLNLSMFWVDSIWAGLIAGFALYLIIGLIAHLDIKAAWGIGIIDY
ncbi:MAG: hypothetical protein U5L10_04140 [Candidatus Moranbacteria bacterium]|nr:hypothetical protein [Candidatus Moranbacteria bacterium]